MPPRVSVLIPAIDGVDHVFRAVEQCRHRSLPEVEILVLCGPAIGAATRQRLQAIWPEQTAGCVTVPDGSPGQLRNAAIGAAAGDAFVFVEAGDWLERGFLAEACRRLDAEVQAGFATACIRRPGAEGLATLERPAATLEQVLARFPDVPLTSVVRRSAWSAVGGFDEALPAGEWEDFVIRLLAHGWTGMVIDAALLAYEPSRTSGFRARLEPGAYALGMRRLFQKHVELFRRHLADVLCGRETTLRERYTHYRRLLRRREDLRADWTALRDQIEEIGRELNARPAGPVEWGDLQRVLPVSADWGYDRGTPVDRYYIERFLESHARDVQGAVLEVQEADYTRRFGGDRVSRSDVIDVNPDNARANLTGDLRHLASVPADSYDCFILTQTIHVIDEMRDVVGAAARVLKPGGVLLATLPCTSRVCLEYGRDGDFWRVTEAGARLVFGEAFPATHVETQAFGNVMTNAAFLEGLARQEVGAEEFETPDPYHPLLVGVRATKPHPTQPSRRAPDAGSGVVLLYHRIAAPALDIHGLCVTPATFRAHLDHLAASYRPMSLIQLAAAAEEGRLPDRAVAITFDDGYADNLRAASPLLLERNLPATFFLTSDGLRGVRAFWWDTLAWIFFGPIPLPPRLDLEDAEGRVSLPTATPAEREGAHWALYHRVRRADAGARERLMGTLSAWSGAVVPESLGRPMTPMEIEELAAHPLRSIGGHGVCHLSFSAHAADVLRREVLENRTELEIATGRVVRTFAYPFGDYDDRSAELVGNAGYRAAVTCRSGLVRPRVDPLRLPRFTIEAGRAASFEDDLRAVFAHADDPAPARALGKPGQVVS
jgi:peptidoglycan/xylan/chitin deacetylase (PgdA/CDA1 family)